MAVYQADALVIRSREYGESDRLVTLFSREHGKIEAVAKGVRKPKSRQRAGTQLFTYADFLLHRGRTLHTVSQASPKEGFPHLWGDFGRTMAATAMAELLDAATLPEQPHPELFTLTLSCFFLLASFEPQLLLAAYALRLAADLGYRPSLVDCAGCGAPLTAARQVFSAEAGGVLCSRCQAADRGKLIRSGSVALMRRLLDGDLGKLDRLRWPAWMEREVLDLIQTFCEHKFERKLKAWGAGNYVAWPVRQDIADGQEGLGDERNAMDRTRES